MKWISLSLLTVWILLLVLGTVWSWESFSNAETLSRGGYIYNNAGEVIGLWDGWDKANYPAWMFSIWLLASLLTSMPVWWIGLHWGIGFWLFLYYYAFASGDTFR